MLDNLIEDGFVLGYGEGDWDLFKSTGDYKAYPIQLGPGEWTRLSVGVKFRAGQQSTLAGSGIIWYLDTGVQLAVHEFPDLEHSPGLALETAANLASKPPHAYAATKRLVAKLEDPNQSETARKGLTASLQLTGKPEEQRMLGALTF